jgi:hypothetical protein
MIFAEMVMSGNKGLGSMPSFMVRLQTFCEYFFEAMQAIILE